MSDSNAQEIVHGAGGSTADAPLERAKKTAPLPEGLEEVNDRELSFGGSAGKNDGSGGSHVHGGDAEKGIGALPGDNEQKQALGKGDADIKDRDGNPGLKKTQGSSNG